MAYLYFTLICLFFGSNFILMDRATRWFGPVEVGFLRLSSAAVLLGILWYVIERKERLSHGRWRHILFVGLVGNSFPYVAQPFLIGKDFGHSFFGVMVSFAPLLTILVSIPMLGIKPKPRQVVGVLAGLMFIGMLLLDGSERGMEPWMLAIAATVPLCYAVGNTWLRKSLGDEPPTLLAALLMVSAAGFLSPLLAPSPVQRAMTLSPPAVREDFWVALGAVLWLGAVGTGACVWMFVRLVQDRGPLFAGMVTYVVPVMALMWGLVDGEAITTRQLIAIGGILSMVALVQAPASEIPDVVQESDDGFHAEPQPKPQAADG